MARGPCGLPVRRFRHSGACVRPPCPGPDRRRGGLAAGVVEACAGWYPGETDLRGYGPVLGRVYAAAHGADLLAALARRP
ncbi:DUF2785 domain-containing protein [Streptomyces sp. QTS52]